MIAVFFIIVITLISVWIMFKLMYPKPPSRFMPTEHDVIVARNCSYCGYPLAEYRGVLEPKPDELLSPDECIERDEVVAYEHQKEEHLVRKQQLEQQRRNIKANPDASYEQKQRIDEELATIFHLPDAQMPQGLSVKEKRAWQKQFDEQQQRELERRQDIKDRTMWFFCNYEHQAEFHREKKTS